MAKKERKERYEQGDLVNFRLTKDRPDILELLNRKKAEGIDIGAYICAAIRAVEGLPTPAQDAMYLQQMKIQNSSIDENELIEKIIAQLTVKGLLLRESSSGDDTEEVVSKATKNDLLKAADKFFDF